MNKHDINQGKVIAVAGNQTTTIDLTNALLETGYSIQYLINVGPEKAHMISDYVDLSDFTIQHNIKLIRPMKYTMLDDESKTLFQSLHFDVLIVVGWQRLIPDWLLQRLSVGAFGMHGSSQPLPKGRGRSPMVWSIIEDRKQFLTNLFRYDSGVDSGQIVGTQPFDINPWDTIRSLQHKNALAQVQLLIKYLPDLLAHRANLIPQPTDVKPTYYPKRVPDDGIIDWRDTSERIDRLVRAVTKPYPGAFTLADGMKLFVWRGHPFDQSLHFKDTIPGEIIASFYDSTFIVKTGDSSFYVIDWEAPEDWTIQKGYIFESHTNPSWEKLRQMAEQE